MPFHGLFTDGEIAPDGSSFRDAYSQMWFANRDKSNYIHLIAACQGTGKRQGIDQTERPLTGIQGFNWCYVFIPKISADYPNASATAVREVSCHEIGHQFGLTLPLSGQAGHIDLWPGEPGYEESHANDGQGKCLMDYGQNWTDGHTEFCKECLMKIRTYPDGFHH